MKTAGRPTGIIASDDELRVVYILGTLMGWSASRIGRIISRHHTTVSTWHFEAKRRVDANLLAIRAKGEKRVRTVSVGSSSQLEMLGGYVEHSGCGGGRMTRNYLPNSKGETKDED